MMAVKCGVADSQELDRKALAALLGTQSDLRVGCEAATAHEIADACRLKPLDVLILDVRLPGGDGVPVIRYVRDLCPATPILALVRERGQWCTLPNAQGAISAGPNRCPCRGHPDCLGQAILDGARCAIARSAAPARFFRAVRRLARKRACFSSERIRSMVECAAHRKGDAADALTARERQVAMLIAGGYCNKEIGERLRVAVATVKKHVGHILAKLQVHDRLQIGLLMAGSPSCERDAAAASNAPPARPRRPRPAAQRVLPK